jgi:probable HAF family extracellular repeat protein
MATFGLIMSAIAVHTAHAQGVSTLAARYTITDLGVLGTGSPGGTVTEANGINNLGKVAGSSGPIAEGGEFHAFVWANGKMQDLGTINNSSPFSSSEAYAINAHGQVTGLTTTGSGLSCGFIWTSGLMRPIGTPEPGFSAGYAINNRGFVAGSTYLSGLPQVTPGQPNFHAFIWRGGTIEDLNVGDYSIAYGINDRNQIVGVSGLDEDTPRFPFLWWNGTFIRLSSFGGIAEAIAINNRGHVTGWFRIGDTFHSWLYANGQSKDIGTIPSVGVNGTTGILAAALNIFDDIVGTYSPDTNTIGIGFEVGFAFLWSHGKMVDLNSYLPTASGWVLNGATGINDFGQIVGNGVHNGLPRAFLLTPIR